LRPLHQAAQFLLLRAQGDAVPVGQGEEPDDVAAAVVMAVIVGVRSRAAGLDGGVQLRIPQQPVVRDAGLLGPGCHAVQHSALFGQGGEVDHDDGRVGGEAHHGADSRALGAHGCLGHARDRFGRGQRRSGRDRHNGGRRVRLPP